MGFERKYSQEFRDEAVRRLVTYLAFEAGVTKAALRVTKEMGVSRTRVVEWAREQGVQMQPSWGDLQRKDAEIAALRARVAQLEEDIELLQQTTGGK